MVKREVVDDPNFMHQAVRGGHTDHTVSIVSLMACIFDLKKFFYATGNSLQSYCYSLGMVKMEAFDDCCFMHQFVTLTNVRMYICMYVCMCCMCVCMYCMGVYMPISPKG